MTMIEDEQMTMLNDTFNEEIVEDEQAI